MPKTSTLAVILATTLATAAAASGAQAHAHLTAATPKADSTGAAPARLTLKFSEGLVARFSGFDLTGPAGAVPVKVSVEGSTLTGAPDKPLAPGAYRVKWRAVSADTHHTQGGYGFTVR